MKFFVIVSLVMFGVDAYSLTSRSTIKNCSVEKLQNFLATPTNWPKIVASSFGVEQADDSAPKKKQINSVDRPLRKGERVKEIFGLPPLVPLTVTWTCQKNEVTQTNGNLEFFSPDGLEGVAKNCRMNFNIASDGNDSILNLTVEVDPVSPLANLARPILQLDNDFALNALLPMGIKKSLKNSY
eukprot:CAMPEP_0194186914 /NCGR_PEP_ID=MMETSP0154-20130528/48848_1 /TAXON_ID=1049557 /ORGANISM="Thalassiothrix antarctica, Strain L6-D1" /LENGTH=183 /DNA_ID=CAMNT_0038906301 /DNA_START=116 /DNA_END=667 /DNA_ORIENTATION=+